MPAQCKGQPAPRPQPASDNLNTSSVPPKGKSATKTRTAGGNSKSLTTSNEVVMEPAPPTKAPPRARAAKRNRDSEENSEATTEATTKKGSAKEPRKPVVGKRTNTSTSPRRSERVSTIPSKDTNVQQRKRRRTKDEMAADKAEAEKKLAEQEERTRKNAQVMAQMDLDEDTNRANTAANIIKSFADLERDSESDMEDFAGYNDVVGSDDSESDSDVEAVEDLKKILKPSTSNKPSKAKALGGKKNVVGGKKNNKQVTFASGLRPDWESRKPSQKPHVQISAGGLDDADAEDINPYPLSNVPHTPTRDNLQSKGEQKRDFSRRNEMIALVEPGADDSDDDYIPNAVAKTGIKPMSKPRQPGASQTVRQPTRFGPSVKSEKPDSKVPPQKAVAKKPKERRLNGNNVRVSDLPEFARSKWRSTFLPTLYDKFYASDEPFDKFTASGDQFIALLQSIIDEIFPDIDYEVTSLEPIHFLAYNRINEKRSSIGSQALTILDAHIQSLEEDERNGWVRWALRRDGPLFFKTPSPIGSHPEDPDYEFPQGRLLSKFVINLATPLLTLRAGSISDNGYPKGLVALILAALERAARYYLKPTIPPSDFSKEQYGSTVKTYYKGVHGVPDSRWQELLDVCGFRGGENDDDSLLGGIEADLSILDHERPFIFDFCSPVKARS